MQEWTAAEFRSMVAALDDDDELPSETLAFLSALLAGARQNPSPKTLLSRAAMADRVLHLTPPEAPGLAFLGGIFEINGQKHSATGNGTTLFDAFLRLTGEIFERHALASLLRPDTATPVECWQLATGKPVPELPNFAINPAAYQPVDEVCP
ncbi:MAG: hypothetical protein ACKVGZ_11030, partial [Alphaproteobacteria bacterium]